MLRSPYATVLLIKKISSRATCGALQDAEVPTQLPSRQDLLEEVVLKERIIAVPLAIAFFLMILDSAGGASGKR